MSMKIYDAYIIEASPDDLHELLNEFQVAVNEAALENMHQTASSLIAGHELSIVSKAIDIPIDSPLKNFIRDGLSLITGVYYKMSDAENKIRLTQQRNPAFDFSCEVVIYPYGKEFLLKFFTEKKEYLRLLETNNKFRKFDYWDNTDKPDDVPVANWNLRRALWNQFSENGTWAQTGYTRQLYKGLEKLKPQYLTELINERYTFEHRLKMYVDTLTEMKVAANIKDYGLALYSDAVTFAQSDKAATIREEFTEKIQPLLQESITVDFITQPIKKE